jgi:hypothetical protein
MNQSFRLTHHLNDSDLTIYIISEGSRNTESSVENDTSQEWIITWEWRREEMNLETWLTTPMSELWSLSGIKGKWIKFVDLHPVRMNQAGKLTATRSESNFVIFRHIEWTIYQNWQRLWVSQIKRFARIMSESNLLICKHRQWTIYRFSQWSRVSHDAQLTINRNESRHLIYTQAERIIGLDLLTP